MFIHNYTVTLFSFFFFVGFVLNFLLDFGFMLVFLFDIFFLFFLLGLCWISCWILCLCWSSPSICCFRLVAPWKNVGEIQSELDVEFDNQWYCLETPNNLEILQFTHVSNSVMVVDTDLRAKKVWSLPRQKDYIWSSVLSLYLWNVKGI